MRLLDLFCGAGGASKGYADAGWEVEGVDIRPQPRYPFTFHQGDALEASLDGFDAIHASPPCQAYSVANHIHGRTDHPDLVDATPSTPLQSAGVPWIMENVPGAPLTNCVMLCGSMFGLGVKRHRLFETNWMIWNPPVCEPGHPGDWVSVYGHSVLSRGHVIGKAKGGGNSIHREWLSVERGREAMGIDWMYRDELSEAIPPAYTRWLGEQLLGAEVLQW